jgi:hypothetical protein
VPALRSNHWFDVTPKFTWRGTLRGVTGFHSRPGGIDPPGVSVTDIIRRPDKTYTGKVTYTDAAGVKVAKSGNGGRSTFFPDDWDHARVEAEILGAWNNRGLGETPMTWSGDSPSGIRLGGYYRHLPDGTIEITSAFPL